MYVYVSVSETWVLPPEKCTDNYNKTISIYAFGSRANNTLSVECSARSIRLLNERCLISHLTPMSVSYILMPERAENSGALQSAVLSARIGRFGTASSLLLDSMAKSTLRRLLVCGPLRLSPIAGARVLKRSHHLSERILRRSPAPTSTRRACCTPRRQ